jgi:hypothetical protein
MIANIMPKFVFVNRHLHYYESILQDQWSMRHISYPSYLKFVHHFHKDILIFLHYAKVTLSLTYYLLKLKKTYIYIFTCKKHVLKQFNSFQNSYIQ